MKSAPLVSVIMNCYNGEKYLREAIDSVFAQTYQNWEIIFWDNQSTDNSASILESYCDDRIKYFYAPTHSLLYEARNYAVDNASGEFLAFLDVDDWWLPNKLEQQMPLFADSDVGLVYGNYWLRDEENNTDKISHKRNLPHGYIINDLLNNYVVGLLTIIIRKISFAKLRHGFNSKYNIIGDFDCVIAIAANYKIHCIQQPIAYYRLHSNNLSIQKNNQLIRELKIWISENSQHPVISTQLGFSHVRVVMLYLRGKSFYERKQYWYAFRMFLLLPMGIEKLKLLAILLLPKYIVNLLKRHRTILLSPINRCYECLF